jgi:hypothetical protein
MSGCTSDLLQMEKCHATLPDQTHVVSDHAETQRTVEASTACPISRCGT